MDNLNLLGSSQHKVPTEPSRDILETFPNVRPGRSYVIALDCPEFSSHCPVTGQPDYAHLSISYQPGDLCVETKSLKFYLASYRSLSAFNEEIVNRIYEDLLAVLQPTKLELVGKFSPRGGIQLTVEAKYPESE